MSHKTICEQSSPDISTSASSLFSNDNLKVRRTSASLTSLSPGNSRRGRRNTISIQDLMGGEKKATDVNTSLRLSRSSLASPNSAESSPTVVHAEDKIHSIIQARKTRQRRRSEISKSLDNASPMLEKKSFDNFSDFSNVLGGLTIPLNDVDDTLEGPEKEGGHRRRRSSGTKGLSPGRLKRSDVSRDHRLRMMKGLDNESPLEKKSNSNGSFLTMASAFSSPKSPNTKANGLRERLRQRLQGVNYCDLNALSSHSGSTSGESTRVKSKAALSDDEDFTADESEDFAETQDKIVRNRSKSRPRRPRSKSSKRISKKEKDTDSGNRDDSLKKPRSKSKSRIRSKSKQKRRSSTKVEKTETEDETSPISRSTSTKSSTSFSRRSGRRPKNLVDEASIVSDDNTEVDCSCEFQSPGSSKSFGSAVKSPLDRKSRRSLSRNSMDTSNSSTESNIVLPGSKKAKKLTKTKKSSHEKSRDEDPSLGFLLDSERTKNRSTDNDDLSHVTEERSFNSSEPQKILLQFDPSSGNHVRSVNQNKAKKTSESIQGLHGMTSNLEISELAGLPTFEKMNTSASTGTTEESPNNSLHDGSKSHFSTILVSPKKQGMARSASMVSPTSGMARSTSMVSPTSPMHQTPGESPYEGGSQNAQWGDFGSVNSARQNRSIGNAGKNKFFNKKGKSDIAERLERPMRRSSDLGARSNSFGALMGLRARYKLRDGDDGESLLKN